MTTQTLANYLGKPASFILAETPFKNWTYEKSIETDLGEPIIDYVFAHNGLDMVCDKDNRISAIFLYFDDERCFDEDLMDIPYLAPRQLVIDLLGNPSKSGGKINDPILGDYGAWDRFTKPGYSVHVEYRVEADRMKKVTLMRADVVPEQ